MAIVNRGYARLPCCLTIIWTHKKYYYCSLSNTNSMHKGIYRAAIKFRGLDAGINFNDSDDYHDLKHVCRASQRKTLKLASNGISNEMWLSFHGIVIH
ncbi:hypothetical protein H5410_062281 [Solanum commersonii]|uniref:AP2/ERF domain-containing protein n=1 Tax=Solanum commersonii TaxID=4109 RepID=A0A9J5W9Y4_SOLCO|nr:hypothetical protein H5410_062281 [Solanum commersonii]